jgi:hypothetical protein
VVPVCADRQRESQKLKQNHSYCHRRRTRTRHRHLPTRSDASPHVDDLSPLIIGQLGLTGLGYAGHLVLDLRTADGATVDGVVAQGHEGVGAHAGEGD